MNKVTTQAKRPQESLIAVGVLGVVGLGLSLVYRHTGWGIECLFRRLTGWDCPFCGSTRMGAALTRGDVVSAWHSNAFLLVVGAVLAIRAVGWIVELIRHRDRGSRWLPQSVTRHGVAIWFGIGIVWTVLRNLL